MKKSLFHTYLLLIIGFTAIFQTSTSEANLETMGLRKLIIEVKPKAQCSPPKPQRRKTRKFLNEVKTYAVNDAKWKAAREYCKDRRMTFMILTEKELKV